MNQKFVFGITFVILLSVLLSSCAPAVAPTRDPLVVQQGTALAAIQTQLAPVTQTPFQPAVLTATPVVEPTAIPPTAQSVVASNEWVPYESEGGVPYNGTTWAVDVAPDEIEVFTAGPACTAGVCLPGGTTRGSVIVFLPGEQVIHHEVTGVIAGSNWHASYRPLGDPVAETTWRSLAEDRIAAMLVAPNCTPGTGCATIDVLIVGPDNKVVAQWVVNK